MMNADYRRAEDLCDGYAEPKKWLFYMDEPAEKETQEGKHDGKTDFV